MAHCAAAWAIWPFQKAQPAGRRFWRLTALVLLLGGVLPAIAYVIATARQIARPNPVSPFFQATRSMHVLGFLWMCLPAVVWSLPMAGPIILFGRNHRRSTTSAQAVRRDDDSLRAESAGD